MINNDDINSEERIIEETEDNDKFYHIINDVVEDHVLDTSFQTDTDSSLSNMLIEMYQPNEFKFQKDENNICIMDLLNFINEMLYTPRLADQFYYKLFKFKESADEQIRFGYEFFEKSLTDKFYQIEYSCYNPSVGTNYLTVKIFKVKKHYKKLNSILLASENSIGFNLDIDLVYEFNVVYTTKNKEVEYTYEFKDTNFVNNLKTTDDNIPLMKFTYCLEEFLGYIYRIFQVQSAMMVDPPDEIEDDDDEDSSSTSHLGKGTNW